MKALTAENRSRVVMAEAEIPLAMSEAFKAGNFYLRKSVQEGNGAA
jgi:uncharacterized protein YqfA (UPF0365 family)